MKFSAFIQGVRLPGHALLVLLVHRVVKIPIQGLSAQHIMMRLFFFLGHEHFLLHLCALRNGILVHGLRGLYSNNDFIDEKVRIM